MPGNLSRLDLLYTKLHPPPVREKLVVRMRLLDKLDTALNQRLTLVCAPAGYGKTTLLSQWVNRLGEPTGWVSLDRSDNDLVQFLRYFLAALHHIEPNLGASLQERLQEPLPLQGSTIWRPLINDLATSEKEFTLILDDYQEVEERVVHEALEYLIEHLPKNLHLIIASRADPPLSLPRLRARGYLSELRLSDLRFSTQEISDFFNNIMSLDLSMQDMTALEARTEGWIASLQMAALSLQMHGPDLVTRSGFIQSFTGSHRFILDYLVEEVLDHQPLYLQDFLLNTSILERLNGSLCDAIVREMEIGGFEGGVKTQNLGFALVNSQTILEHLETANLFIVPLDEERRWYRYHRLFSDLLRKRLRQMHPDRLPALHRCASRWYEQHGFTNLAIDHALAGQDFDRAVEMIEDNVETILMQSEVKTFLNWLEKLPGEYIDTRPELGFYHAWALLMNGSPMKTVEQRLQSIRTAQDATPGADVLAGKMAVLHAYLFLFQADFRRAAAECLQALEYLPEEDLLLRNIATWILSMVRLSVGDAQDGIKTLDNVIRFSQEIGNPLIAVAALAHQARLQMRQGRLQLARDTLEKALQVASDPQGQRLPIASEALIVLGELEREWNLLEKAAEHLTESIQLSCQWNELASFDAYYPLMRVRLAQGDIDAAREALETALQISYRSDITDVDDYLADLQRAHFYLALGDFEEIMRWADKCGLLTSVPVNQRVNLNEKQEYIQAHLRKYENLILARAWIRQGRSSEALELLEPLFNQARQLNRTDLTIEIQILRALAYQVEGREDLADAALEAALTLAQPGGYVRIFLDEGEPTARLLHRVALKGVVPAYVAKLLSAFGEPTSPQVEIKPTRQVQPLVEPLSERELEVLRLLANGMSNPEIADELVVAVSTIHSHCKSIYGKLSVHKRWDAVRRAQELDLI